MLFRILNILLVGVVLLNVTSCMTGARHGHYENFPDAIVAEQGPSELEEFWMTCVEDIECHTQQILTEPLTLKTMLQLALLRNPRIQQAYAEVGLSSAELFQAGLLSNPLFGGSWKRLNFSDSPYALEMSLMQPLLDLLTRPTRIKVANSRLEATRLRAASQIMRVLYEVKLAYWEYQFAKTLEQVMTDSEEAWSLAWEVEERLLTSGNTNQLSLLEWKGRHLDAVLRLTTQRRVVIINRNRLSQLMALDPQTSSLWEVSTRDWSASPPKWYDCLLERSLKNNFDLRALTCERHALYCELAPTVAKRRWSEFGVGVEAERETDDTWLGGPAIEVSLPVFDWGQAVKRRFEALIRRNQAQAQAIILSLMAVANGLEAEFELLHEQVLLLRQKRLLAAYSFTEQMQLHYNAMQVGVQHLLVAKAQELDILMQTVQAEMALWRVFTRAEALGSGLTIESLEMPL